LKFQLLGRILQKDYQLDAIQGYLVRLGPKIKTYRDVALHWRAYLAITSFWSTPVVIHTHTHTHTKKQTALT
jgi:hypothetical protein